MAGGGSTGPEPPGGNSILTLLVVAFFAALGGLFVKWFSGIKVPGCGKSKGCETKPVCTAVTIPPLIGMIIFGCIARNFFGEWFKVNYNDNWASWVRIICLSVILLRGGLELDFRNKGCTVVGLTLVPQLVEATAVALAARGILDMPWSLCFALGFIIGAVSPAVLVPSCMNLQS